MSTNREARALEAIWLGLAIVNGLFGFFFGKWWSWAAAAGCVIALVVTETQRRTHERRRAVGDCGDTGTGEAADAAIAFARELARRGADPRAVAAAAGQSPGRVELPITQGMETIRAWKWTDLTWSHRTGFQFMNYGGPWVSVAPRWSLAVCSRHFTDDTVLDDMPHGRVPSVECSCGFYAMNERPTIFTIGHKGTHALMEVELCGRVLVCESGYRAEKQRPIRLVVDTRCEYCLGPVERFEIPDGHAPVDEFPRPIEVAFRCEEHLRRGDDDVQVRVEKLPGLLGVPIEPMHDDR